MMRLCCLSLSYARQFNAGTMDIFKFLDTCRELNLDGVSVHIRNLSGTDKAHLKEVRRRGLDLGLTMACFCVSTRFGGPDDTHPAEIAKAREAMEVGMFLGAPLLRVFVGRVPDGDDYETAFQRGVRGLRKTAEMGAEFGMPVALQNHSGLTSTGDEMVRFKKEINHPNFTLLLDTGHFTGRKGPNGPVHAGHDYGDYYDSIAKVAPLTQFVRAKLYDLDEQGREKWIDYDKVFNILRGVHFNGFISLVYEGKEDQSTAIPRGNRFLRSFLTVC